MGEESREDRFRNTHRSSSSTRRTRSRSRSRERTGRGDRTGNRYNGDRRGNRDGRDYRDYGDSYVNRRHGKEPPAELYREDRNVAARRDSQPHRGETPATERKVVNVPIHPLLAMSDAKGVTTTTSAPLLPVAAVSSTMANQRAGLRGTILQQQERKKAFVDPTAAFLSVKPAFLPRNTAYFDKHLPAQPKKRGPRSLVFHEKGTFERQGEEMRSQAELEQLQREVAEGLCRVGIETEMVADLLTVDSMPLIDWWDAPFYGEDSLIDGIQKELLRFDQINSLIQRPALIPPPLDMNEVVAPQPLKLTKQETKKLRRQRRLAGQREKQEQIKLGLLPPEPQKVRIANIARILGDESAIEPSKVEASIRAQAVQRHRQHLATNQERAEEAKLLSQEKAVERKEQSAVLLNVSVAAFKVENLAAPQWKYKVNINAQQNELTGCCITYDQVKESSAVTEEIGAESRGFTLIFAEGPAAGIRRYKHLLTERIKWNEWPTLATKTDNDAMAIDTNNAPANIRHNKCTLLWEGTQTERLFRKFMTRAVTTELDAKEFLARHAIDHFWRVAKETN